MTGFRSRDLRHVCSDATCYLDLLPWWDDIVDCFDSPNKPRHQRIRPTDVDGMVEINGRFLFLEEKGAGVPIPAGQGLAYRRLANLGEGLVTVKFLRPVHRVRSSNQIPDPVEVLSYPNAEGWQAMPRAEMLAQLRGWAADARGAT